MNKIIALFLCIVLIGASTFFRKLGVDKLHPYQLQIISCVIHTVTIPIWLYLFYRVPAEVRPDYYSNGLLFVCICSVMAILSSIIFSFVLVGSKNPGTLSALVSLNPIITLIMSFIFLQERLTGGKMLAFIFALLSVVFLNF